MRLIPGYPSDILCEIGYGRILRVDRTKPHLYQLFAFPTEKSEQLVYLGTYVFVLGYPGIGRMSSYPVISHLFLLNLGISRDRLG